MKKIIAAILSAAVLFSFSACGSKPVEVPDQHRVSTAELDSELIGTWSNGSAGYRFQDDRRVSLIIDQSDYVHFDGKNLIVNGQTLTPDTIEYDGSDLRAYYTYDNRELGEKSDMDILLMTRMGDPDRKSYNGRYRITGGVVQEVVGEEMAKTVSKTLAEMDIQAEVNDDKFTVIINDYCSYETVDGRIELFDEHMNYADPNADCIAYLYSIDKDTLKMTYTSNQGTSTTVEEFKKVK